MKKQKSTIYLLLAILCLVVIGGGAYYFYQKSRVSADNAVGTPIMNVTNNSTVPFFSVDTGSEFVKQGDTVNFKVNLLNISKWVDGSGFTPRADVKYMLVGSIFNGIKQTDGNPVVKGGYNFFQYITPYYSNGTKTVGTVPSIFNALSSSGRVDASTSVSSPEGLTYNISAKVPAGFNINSNQLLTKFWLVRCTSSSTLGTSGSCNIKPNLTTGTNVNPVPYSSSYGKLIALSNEVSQTIITGSLADLELVNISQSAYPTSNNKARVGNLMVNNVSRPEPRLYLVLPYRNIGTGYTPTAKMTVSFPNLGLVDSDGQRVDQIFDFDEGISAYYSPANFTSVNGSGNNITQSQKIGVVLPGINTTAMTPATRKAYADDAVSALVGVNADKFKTTYNSDNTQVNVSTILDTNKANFAKLPINSSTLSTMNALEIVKEIAGESTKLTVDLGPTDTLNGGYIILALNLKTVELAVPTAKDPCIPKLLVPSTICTHINAQLNKVVHQKVSVDLSAPTDSAATFDSYDLNIANNSKNIDVEAVLTAVATPWTTFGQKMPIAEGRR